MEAEKIPVLNEAPAVFMGGAVSSVNGQTGDVVLDAGSVGAATQDDIESAVSAEAEARATADQALDDKINTEAVARESSDNALGLRIDATDEAVDDLDSNLSIEERARRDGDNTLQSQIDAISASSDVTDIVGTRAELDAYDTSLLRANDIIKVLQDESEGDATTYYRWDATSQQFVLIGEEGPYYTKSGADAKFQEKLEAGENITINDGVISAEGGGVNIVQDAGVSTTDAMSQKAVTDLIYPSWSSLGKLCVIIPGANEYGAHRVVIGSGSNIMDLDNRSGVWIGTTYRYGGTTIGEFNIAIGDGDRQYPASASTVYRAIAIGGGTLATHGGSIALGFQSVTGRVGELSIGSGSSGSYPTRFIANVKDPERDQDAATKHYVDTQIAAAGGVETITNEDWEALWQ